MTESEVSALFEIEVAACNVSACFELPQSVGPGSTQLARTGRASPETELP